MEVKVKFPVDPFPIPKTVTVSTDPVRKQLNLKPIGDILLSELSVTELESLCVEFRVGVFKEAGKELPPTAI